MINIIIALFSIAQASWFLPDNSINRGAITPPVSIVYGPIISYTTQSPTPIPSVDYTSKGGSVMLMLAPADVVGIGSGAVSTQVSGGSAFGEISFTRNGAVISTTVALNGPNNNAITSFAPCSSFRMIDSPPIGPVTYNIVPSIKIVTSATSQYFIVNNCRLVIVEI